MSGESSTPTPYAVRCNGIDPGVGYGPCNPGKLIFLTQAAYDGQMNNPYSVWRCPRCGATAQWDDRNYEERTGQ